ncbi:MAG: DUF108 domain-containing protein [Rhodoferax sp.]|nr:DUF108 domain-containing protein [Rhodoferax sp.]
MNDHRLTRANAPSHTMADAYRGFKPKNLPWVQDGVRGTVMTMPSAMIDQAARSPSPPVRRRIGLLGHGRIGGAVARAVASGRAGAWEVAAILSRGGSGIAGAPHHADPERFFAVPVDLYLECAGPQALARYGAIALERADVWSVSGVALIDDALRARLQIAGERFGHRLRLVAGAAGGLDAVQALALDPELELQVGIVAPERCPSFAASVREAARRLPNGVNLAVAAALAGPGPDRTRVEIIADPDPMNHAIHVQARSALGRFDSQLRPLTDTTRDRHVVAASLLAALRQADQVIWVG